MMPILSQYKTDARTKEPSCNKGKICGAACVSRGFECGPRGTSGTGTSTGGDRIRTARPDITRKGNESLIPDDIRANLNGHQRQGVALAKGAMDSQGAFLLADSTGVGKTRQQIAIALMYAREGKRVLIVSKSGVLQPDWANGKVSGSFAEDSEAMGVRIKLASQRSHIRKGSVSATTYDRLDSLAGGVDKNTVLILDEAHSFKNKSSKRSRSGIKALERADKVLYATATPIDKLEHLDYLSRLGVFGDRTSTQFRRFANSKDDDALGLYGSISSQFDELTKKGLMIRRELTFDGLDVGFQTIKLPAQAKKDLVITDKAFSNNADRAQRLMTQRRQLEPYKIPAATKEVQSALADGRQAIVFVSRVNDSNTPAGVSSATARSLRESLAKAGITDVAELHGSSKMKGPEVVQNFQGSKARVLITTVESGGTGINLDDVVGDKPRTVVMMTPPFSAVENVQAVGRVWRYNTKSRPEVKYLFSDMPVDKWNQAIISTKMKTLEANVQGEVGALQIPEVRTDSIVTQRREFLFILPAYRDDARKVAVKTKSGMAKIPGKACGGGYISAAYRCGEHYTNGKLNDKGKAAAGKLSEKVKAIKGIKTKETLGDYKSMTPEQERAYVALKPPAYAADVDKSEWAKLTKNAKPGAPKLGSSKAKPVETEVSDVTRRLLKQMGKTDKALSSMKETANKITAKAKPVVKSDRTFKTSEGKSVDLGLNNIGQVKGSDRVKFAEAGLKASGGNILEKTQWEGALKRAKASADKPVATLKGKKQTSLFGDAEKIPVFNTGSKSVELKLSKVNQLSGTDRIKFAQEGLKVAREKGDLEGVRNWNKALGDAQKQAFAQTKAQRKTKQADIFGALGQSEYDYDTSTPLFSSRKDSVLNAYRIDRMAGAKAAIAQKKGEKCGRGYISASLICHKGGVSAYQSQLKTSKQSGNDLKARSLKMAITSGTSDKRSQLKDKQIKALRQKKSSGGEVGKPGSVAEISPKDVRVDPDRFQYKRLSNDKGEVGSLSGVKKYDPNLAGIVQVWKDPADGNTYVTNGHNRLGLANRAGADKIAVRFLDVPDAKTARAVSALTNIAEGRGDELDAAKFFKESGISRADLERKGIPMREKIATNGIAIAKLESTLYNRVMTGGLDTGTAAIIGSADLAPEQQRSLVKLIDSRSKKRELTQSVLKELVDTAKASATQSQTSFTLFGEEEIKQSLTIERAQLQAGIKRRLASERKLFGTVGKSKSAQSLSRAGNQINVEGSQTVSKQAAAALDNFDRMKNLKGEVSDRINDAARRVAAGENIRTVEADLYREVLGNVA